MSVQQHIDGFASFSGLAYDSTDGDMDVFVLVPNSNSPLGASIAWGAYWSPLFLNLALVGETTLVANEHLGIQIDVCFDVTLAASSGNGWADGYLGDSRFLNLPAVNQLFVQDVMNPTHLTVADGTVLQWADGWNIQIPYSYTWDRDNEPFASSVTGDGTAGYVSAVVVRIMNAPSADVTISGSFGWRAYPTNAD